MPEGAVVWAIGDVHGRDDLLGPLLVHILADLDESRPAQPIIVALGDYVDRGADSRGVIDRLLGLQASGIDCTFLMGNHEETLLTFLSDPRMGPTWAQFGGRETLWSYGVRAPSVGAGEAEWTAASRALAEALPPEHLAFLQDLELSREIGDYVFVHAGLRPGLAMEAQTRQDMLWIRHEFLDHVGAFPKVVVHGHTPMERVIATPHRLGVDTGAYATSVLSAVRLFATVREVATARMSGRRVTVERRSL